MRANAAEGEDLFDLPLEHLMNIEITSASKKPENAKDVPSAIFVITQDDIRRSGATTIPEVLRLAPGVHVARMDSSKWVIASRGFSNQYSNKLLVMIDGRTVYTPNFSGVFWDVQDTLLEDVERIEVIRGPGGAIWGANAVNGVINIITRHSKDTQGTYASAGYGSYERGNLEARQGGEMDEDGTYRVYARGFAKDDSQSPAGISRNDEWSRVQSGFRMDWETQGNDRWKVQGDTYYGQNDYDFTFPNTAAPYFSSNVATDEVTGGNMVVRWERDVNADSTVSVQSYYDHTRRNEQLADQVVQTADIEAQHTWRWSDRNELVSGVGYRWQTDEFDGGEFVTLASTEEQYDLISGFVQNEYQVVPDKVSLAVGTKIEVNDYTGTEFQPSAKMSMQVDDRNTVWWSVSRAVRTPSRVADGVDAVLIPVPPNTLAANTPAGLVEIFGNKTLKPESVVAYELGYRTSPVPGVSVDVAAFYNEYTNLFTVERGLPSVQNNSTFGTYLSVPTVFDNRAKGESYGVEVSSRWKVNDSWTLGGNYSYLKLDISGENSTDTTLTSATDNTPEHMWMVHSSSKLPYDMEMDNLLYYYSSINADDYTNSLSVDGYARFDTRLGWRPKDSGFELSLMGQNLLSDGQSEFAAPLYSAGTSEFDRSYYLRATIRH